MKHKKIHLKFLLSVKPVTSLCMLFTSCNLNYQTNYFNELKKITNTIGVWQWEIKNINDDLIKFMHKNNIKEIYLKFFKLDENTKKILNKIKQKGINIYLLLGKKEWIENDQELIGKLNYFNSNKEFGSLCKGIHLDIEPHQFKDKWKDKAKQKKLLYKFLNLSKKLNNLFPDWQFDYDIPFWFNHLINFEGLEQEFYKHLMNFANRVFIMSYRNNNEQILKISEKIQKYAREKKKKIFIAVNTSKSENKNTTFYDHSQKYFVNELIAISKKIDSNIGIAIHHLETMQKLKR